MENDSLCTVSQPFIIFMGLTKSDMVITVEYNEILYYNYTTEFCE